MLIVVVAVAVVQVALVVHTRSMLTDAAVQGAHAAALEGNTLDDGIGRAHQVVTQSLGAGYDAEVTATQDPDGLIRIEISATLPLVGMLGPGGTLHTDGHAIAEESW